MRSIGNCKQCEKATPSEWEKIIANETTDKGLISKTCKQLIQVNARKANNQIKKWGKDLNRHFSKDVQMANKHMKRCSTLLIIREMQIKTIIRHHFTPVRMAITKKSTNNNGWRTCSDKGALLHCPNKLQSMVHDVIHVSHLYSKMVEAWKLSWEISDTWFRWLSMKADFMEKSSIFLCPVYLLMGLTHFLRFPSHYRII